MKYKFLENSEDLTPNVYGCVIQRPGGEKVVLKPDEAKSEFEKMNPEHRNLYC